MAINFPLSLNEFWDKLPLLAGGTEFDLLPRQKQTEDGAGNTMTAFFGAPKWVGEYTIAPVHYANLGKVQPLFKALQNRDGTFLAYDRRQPHPAADPGGRGLERGSMVDIGEVSTSGDVVTGTYTSEGQPASLSTAVGITSDAGTYFDADGFLQSAGANTHRIDYGPFANLLSLTNFKGFTNSYWQKVGTTVTGNVVKAPDGSVTGDFLKESGSSGGHYLERTALPVKTNGDITWSIFVKPRGRSRVQLAIYDSVTANSIMAAFNLATGTRTTLTNNGTASGADGGIEALNNGWYRLWVSGKPASADTGALFSCRLLLLNDAGAATYTGDSVSGVYLWAGVVNYGTAPIAYPRRPIGIVAEGGFTNRLTRSRAFDHADWSKTRASVTSDVSSVLDPWGTNLADKLVEDSSAANSHFIRYVYTTTSYVNHVAYVIAKAAERTKIQLQLNNFSGGEARATFDLVAGSVMSVTSGAGDFTGASALIKDLGNGWYWCEMEALKVTGDTDCNVLVVLCDASGSITYNGDGSSGVYLAHAQMEEGLTGHMPLVTTSATISRAADVLNFRAIGTNDFWLTFENGSQQGGPGAVGNWPVSGNSIFRPLVRGWTATRAVNPTPSTVRIKSKGADNRSISIKGLPMHYAITKGDKISVQYGSRRFLCEAMETVMSDAAGDTVEFEVMPFLPSALAVNDVVTLSKPCGKFKLVSGSYRPASGQGNISSGASFAIVSVP